MCDAMIDDCQLPEWRSVSQASGGVRADVVGAGIASLARWAGRVALGLIGVVVRGVVIRGIPDIGGMTEPDGALERPRAARVPAIGPSGTRFG